MPRKLKTFRAHLGFYDTVVAAPSKKAALEAWGSRQDLFREGFAKETDDPEAQRDALAAPGQVLRRPFGSHDRFSQNPGLPSLGKSRSRAASKAARQEPARSADARPPGKKAAARTARDSVREKAAAKAAVTTARRKAREEDAARRKEAKLKSELRQLERDEEAALAQLARRREQLDKQERETQAGFQKKRERLRASYGPFFRPRLVTPG
jgi:colicin import membrane protein